MGLTKSHNTPYCFNYSFAGASLVLLGRNSYVQKLFRELGQDFFEKSVDGELITINALIMDYEDSDILKAYMKALSVTDNTNRPFMADKITPDENPFDILLDQVGLFQLLTQAFAVMSLICSMGCFVIIVGAQLDPRYKDVISFMHLVVVYPTAVASFFRCFVWMDPLGALAIIDVHTSIMLYVLTLTLNVLSLAALAFVWTVRSLIAAIVHANCISY